MPFFGSSYTLRRYGEDKIIDGYPTAGYEDIQVILDVQTLSDDEVIEAGGIRDECVRSDQLLYDGRWFECMSSRLSRNTILKHWTSTFKLIPVSENKEPSNSEIEETE